MMDGKAVPESGVFLGVLWNSSKTRRAEIKPSKELGLAGLIAVEEASRLMSSKFPSLGGRLWCCSHSPGLLCRPALGSLLAGAVHLEVCNAPGEVEQSDHYCLPPTAPPVHPPLRFVVSWPCLCGAEIPKHLARSS